MAPEPVPAPALGRAQPQESGQGVSTHGPPRPPRPSPPGRKGYDWCLDKCFLFDFLILVFSEKALASSNSFLRVAGAERPVSRRASPRMGAGGGATGKRWGGGRGEGSAPPSREAAIPGWPAGAAQATTESGVARQAARDPGIPAPAATGSSPSWLSFPPPPPPSPPPELVLGFP